MRKQLLSIFFLALSYHCATLVNQPSIFGPNAGSPSSLQPTPNLLLPQPQYPPGYIRTIPAPNLPPSCYFCPNCPDCYVDCSKIPHSSGRSMLIANSCSCFQGYQWNGKSCEPSTIVCKEGYIQIGRLCELDCTKNYKPPQLECLCIRGSRWTGSSCIYQSQFIGDCGRIKNSTGRKISDLVCECNPGFEWKNFYCDAIRDVDCNIIKYSRGQMNSTVCYCQSGFVWKNKQCQRDCSGVANSNGEIWTIQSCYCNLRFRWIDNRCQFYPVNCSADPHSTGREKQTQVCQCNIGYKWDGRFCVEDRLNFNVNCNSIANSRGQQNFMTCNCLQGYVWTDRLCQRDCARVANSNGQRSSPQSCQCNSGFTWRDNGCQSDRVASIRPTIDCRKIPNADGPAEPNCCKCKKGYRWERNSCMKDNTPVRSRSNDQRRKYRL